MLRYALFQCTGPVALRYPRGGEGEYRGDAGPETAILRTGGDLTLVGYGTLINEVLQRAAQLAELGIEAEVVKVGRITPFDPPPILDSVRKTGYLLVAEESNASNCIGQRLAADLLLQNIPVKGIALQNLGNRFIPHGTVEQLRELCGLRAEQLTKRAEEVLRHGKKET